MRHAAALLLPFCMLAALASHGHAQSWTTTLDIPLVSRWPDGTGKVHEQKVSGDLFRPRKDGRVPAAVIINSSGGVQPHTELYWARQLAMHGVAALVVDSFTPRGVRSTVKDQRSVWQSQSNVDAGAGFRWLAAQTWVDASRIVVLGMSRGGIAAIAAAVEMDRRRHQLLDVKFAAHIAIAPNCGFQMRDARTTGAPILFMLSELDDYTPIRPCLEYSERMRAAGNSKVRLAVYPGVHHALEWHGGIGQEPDAERYRNCSFMRKNDSTWTDRRSGKDIPSREVDEYLKRTCIDRGPVTVGGEWRVKQQATADLLQFLREIDIIEDAEARTLVGDCAIIKDAVLQQNCERARAGWMGDLVALARAYRYPGRLPSDAGLAARMFGLAAARGHPQAQWELGYMHWLGVGVPRDPVQSLALLKDSAAAGESAAMNLLGVAARDGMGRARDDAEAVLWFTRAAEQRHQYALANLGRMNAQGRGGLARDPAEAVRLYRKAVHFDNPWGRLWLAEALEKGEGADRDTKQAIEHFRAAAGQEREPEARKAAIAALTRLGAAP